LIRASDLTQCCASEKDKPWEISDLMARASECYENVKTCPNGKHFAGIAIVKHYW